MFQPGTGCPREPPRCPGNSTAVKDTQSRGYGLMETAARLRFCTSRQGLPSRPVLNLAVPLATQHCEMLTFSSSRVPAGTRPAKQAKQSVFSRQLSQGRRQIFPGSFGRTRNLVLRLLEGSGNVALLKERAECCPSPGTHTGPPRGRAMGLDVARPDHGVVGGGCLEVLSDPEGKWMHTRGA